MHCCPRGDHHSCIQVSGQKRAIDRLSSYVSALIDKLSCCVYTLQGPEDPQVALLNVVAAVVGAYFGQDAELLNALGPDADLP